MIKTANTIFKWKNDNKDILELTLKEKLSKYSCIIDIKKNGRVIFENKDVYISKYMSKPDKLFLVCHKENGGELAICICDKSKENDFNVEENRRISNWLWQNIQELDRNAISYEFSVEHKANFED